MWILGINSGLNSSAVLLNDGVPIFGIQEERLTRIKNQPGYPSKSIAAALDFAGIKKTDVDLVCVGGKSTKTLYSRAQDLNKYHQQYSGLRAHARENQLIRAIQKIGHHTFFNRARKSAPERGDLESYLKKDDLGDRVLFFDHHLCHAASAYFGLARKAGDRCLVFTLDGGGDRKTAGVFVGEGDHLSEISSSRSMSLGSLYAHITYILGFVPHEHEYKLMGLAPYTNPRYAESVKESLEHLVKFSEEDPLQFVNPNYQIYGLSAPAAEKQMWIEDLYRRIQFQRFDNVAAGLQLFVEGLAVQWIKRGIKATGITNAVLSGGFFMNVKANQLIAKIPELTQLNCFPSCGDETNAFGAAFLGFQKAKKVETKSIREIQFGQFCIGSEPGPDLAMACRKFKEEVNFEKLMDVNQRIAEEIANDKIVARCSGRMEFGARALGNRSILAAPNNFKNIQRINRAIKKRDFWMPFAPAILKDQADRYIYVPKALQDVGSPYMMFTFDAKPDFIGDLVCGTHQADQTVRAQLVTKEFYPDLYEIISAVHELNGIPAVLNTSFNLHGFPIVNSTTEALEVFIKSDLDLLFVEDMVFSKKK
jgi:carbamoyltransferase